MRRYFMQNKKILGFEGVYAPSDAEAIELAWRSFERRRTGPMVFDGFELWDGKRLVFSHATNATAA